MSASTTSKTYKNIRVSNPSEAVWVSPMDDYDVQVEEAKNKGGYDNYIILIGPTGCGKSSFVEAIASKSTREPLGISKDQLESVTQQPCIYEIKNLVDSYGYKIYIVDTPGFADPRISELEVLDRITHWRNRCNQSDGFIRLLYFHPITDIRMPGSRKRCIKMVQHFWSSKLSTRAMLVTSMWDRVPERSRRETEARFSQLSARHWGDWTTEGSKALKFENTFDSAMEILNTLCVSITLIDKYPTVSGLGIEGTTGNPVYEALSIRIASLEQQRATLLEDLARPESQGQPQLMSLLSKDWEQTERLLRKFTSEMDDFLKRFGPPQDSPQEGQTAGAVEVIDAAVPTGTDEPVDSNPISEPPQTTQTPHSMEPIDTAPTATGVAVVDVEAQKVSLSKRLGLWVHKKVDDMHLGRSGQKGV